MAIGRKSNAASDWKKNSTIPKESELRDLAKLLNCEVADFFEDRPTFETTYDAAVYHDRKRDEALSEMLSPEQIELVEIYARIDGKKNRMQFMLAVYDAAEAAGVELQE